MKYGILDKVKQLELAFYTKMNLVEKKKCPLAKIKLHQFPKKCVRKWSRNVLSILLLLWLW